MGIKQHISIFPTVAQMLLKSSIEVGTDGAVICVSNLLLRSVGKRNIRVSQSRSATPRTSTSQHCWVPEEQITAWRVSSMAGTANVVAASAKRVMNEVLIFVVLGWTGLGWKVEV